MRMNFRSFQFSSWQNPADSVPTRHTSVPSGPKMAKLGLPQPTPKKLPPHRNDLRSSTHFGQQEDKTLSVGESGRVFFHYLFTHNTDKPTRSSPAVFAHDNQATSASPLATIPLLNSQPTSAASPSFYSSARGSSLTLPPIIFATFGR